MVEAKGVSHRSREEGCILVWRDEAENGEGRRGFRNEVIPKFGLLGINMLKKER